MEEKKKPEDNEEINNERVATYVVVPPDGGWGWVIVTASFLCNLVVDGIVFSFGVFLNEISQEFGVSKAQVTLAGSLLSGFYLIAGPFVSGIANRYGFRCVSIMGSVIGSAAFVISSFAPNMQILFLSYGILGGIGFGMIYVPAVIACGFYFERWRALATGISVCGSGIGTIIMGPITAMLIKYFGWRGTILIQAAIILHCAVFGGLFRPLKPVHVSVSNQSEETEEQTNLPLLQRIKLARDQMRTADSTASLEDVGLTAVQPTEVNSKILKANNNSLYPTAADILNSSSYSISRSNHSLHSNRNHAVARSRTELNELLHKNEKKHSVDYKELKESSPDEGLLNHEDAQRKHRTGSVTGQDLRRDSFNVRVRSRTISESSHKSVRSRRNTLSKIDAGVRPMYRDDIFLSSLHRLPQYTSKGSGLDYTMSVTRLPTCQDIQEEEESKCVLCPEAFRRTLATMLDFSLLMSPTYVLFSLAGFMTMMGLFVPFMYLADRAVLSGIDPSMAVWIVSSIGITNTLGRIVCGAVTGLPGMNALVINNVALTVGGIATMLSGLSQDKSYQFTYAIVFGMSIACFASLRSIIIVDLIGLDRLTNGFGILLLFQGVASVIGSPVAGMFMDLTGSYDASFYMSGGLILLSGVMCYPLNMMNKWETRRRERKQAEEESRVV
ncbi:hypothetical protein AAG570_011213 [Ranatra chinensis]|uniref:Major facilitator superfamily (MFS) profile domain-containing protein n=1 Tax=Ranatra chinensis TaxID=642074 RepID=A0ABD0YM50_9HEMI